MKYVRLPIFVLFLVAFAHATDQGQVVIYRQGGQPLVTVPVFVDGSKIADFGKNTKLTLELAAGRHIVGGPTNVAPVEVEVQPGQAVFVRYRDKYEPFTTTFHPLEVVEPSVGIRDSANLKSVDSKHVFSPAALVP